MYETIFQETTGVKLYREEEQLLSTQQWEQFNHKWNNVEHTFENEAHVSQTEICEVFFDSPMAKEQKEKFLITIEKKGKNKVFTLKRRAKVGTYGSETTARLTKKQYFLIMKGNLEWMKNSAKILLNEFYLKVQIFEYQISSVITCLRQDLLLRKEEILITVDSHINCLFHEGDLSGIIDYQKKPAYVRIRSTKEKQDIPPHLFQEWLQ